MQWFDLRKIWSAHQILQGGQSGTTGLMIGTEWQYSMHSFRPTDITTKRVNLEVARRIVRHVESRSLMVILVSYNK